MDAQERAKNLAVVTRKAKEAADARDRAESFLASMRTLREQA